ncbi:MAG: ligase-associated DNA damage response endonuclease PdeM [Alphaproteobacteria bacterium]|nr:ligase-associated DNA damage response endonuclease PdeM [Alphaproteobacteria bacterium]
MRTVQTMSPLTVNGADLVADHAGALWWPERRVMVVADLHFEKGSALGLPPYDSRETLARLEQLRERLNPAQVIALGDSFHDRSAESRFDEEDGRRLRRLTDACDWVWIEGNHDPAPAALWGGRVAEEIVIGPLVFRHQAERKRNVGEVSGHYHPKLSVAVRGRMVTGRCFLSDGTRLVLPAFGAFTGGLDARDPALRRLFGRGLAAHVLGVSRVVRVPLG